MRQTRLWGMLSPFKRLVKSGMEYRRLKEIYGAQIAGANTFFFKRAAEKYVRELMDAQKTDTCEERILFSVVVPLFNTEQTYLIEMIESVLSQTYKKFQLVLSDASDNHHKEVEKICRSYAAQDTRITYRRQDPNLGIAANTNEALKLAQGSYVAFLDHDDKLMPNALAQNAKYIGETGADMLYSDELMFENDNTLDIYALSFKSDFCIYDIRSVNFVCHLMVVKREILQKIGGLREQYNGAQDHDLVLRIAHKTRNIVHIPEILYRWRVHKGSTAAGTGIKSYASEAGLNAVSDELKRSNVRAGVVVSKAFPTVYQIRYICNETPQISRIVIDKKMTMAEIFRRLSAEQTDMVLLCREGVEISDESVQELVSYAVRSDIGGVGGLVTDRKGNILSNGVEYRDQRNQFITLDDRGPVKYQQALNRRLYYARSVDEVRDLLLLRKSVLLECVEDAPAEDIIAGVCKALKQHGYLIISDPYAEVFCESEIALS